MASCLVARTTPTIDNCVIECPKLSCVRNLRNFQHNLFKVHVERYITESNWHARNRQAGAHPRDIVKICNNARLTEVLTTVNNTTTTNNNFYLYSAIKSNRRNWILYKLSSRHNCMYCLVENGTALAVALSNHSGVFLLSFIWLFIRDIWHSLSGYFDIIHVTFEQSHERSVNGN